MHRPPWVIAIAIICFVGIHEVYSWGTEPLLDKYDPFKPKCKVIEGENSCWSGKSKVTVVQEEPEKKINYKAKLKWSHLFFGDMTASAAAFVSKDNIPEQITVFSVRGVVLSGSDVSSLSKDGKFQKQQLLFIDGYLWLYPSMRIKDSNNDLVVVVKKELGKNNKPICKKKQYKIEAKRTVAEPTKVEVFEDNFDEDCSALLKGESGPFPVTTLPIDTYEKVGNVWAINQLDNFGIKFLKYTNPFCHEKVVISYNGTPLTGTALFCGENSAKNLVVTQKGVYLEKDIVARFSPTDPNEITVFLDPRDGGCIKHQFRTMSSTNTPKITQQSRSIMHELDQECRDFKEGKLVSSEQINKDWKASVIASIQADQVNVVPHNIESYHYGPQQPKYDLNIRHIYAEVNTGKDMGVLIVERSGIFWVYLVAKGVVIDVALLRRMPRLVVEKDKIIYEKALLFRRDRNDQNLFTVLANWDHSTCSRTRYVLINKGGNLQRQELFPSYIGVCDSECKELLRQELRKETGRNDSPDSESLGVLQEKSYEAMLVDYM